jgi:D-amino-acid dehydrogenase
MSTPTGRTIVVGGGVIGLCTAYYLAKEGMDVCVLERDRIGSGASSGNAGAVAPGHGPMAKPGRILQALRWMGDPTSPLYMPPRFNPSLFRWLWTFRRHCTEAHVLRSMQTLGPLGHDSRDLFDELVREEGLACHYRPTGYYEVYRTEKGMAGAREEIPLQRAYGYDTQEVAGETLREYEPALKPGTLGGLFFPEAAVVDPLLFLEELAGAAISRGMALRTGAEVKSLVASHGKVGGVRLAHGEVVEGDAVVLATGAYSLKLARIGGLSLPIQPAKGYHRDLPVGFGGAPELNITVMLGERYVFCTPLGGFLRLAGTLELSGLNHRMVGPRLSNLNESAAKYVEGMENAVSTDDWVGLRPVTPDGMPVLGAAPTLEGLYVANGHAMLGLTLGPITGKLMADMIVGNKPSRDLAPLRPDRF